MAADRMNQLSRRERDCLRLVGEARSSKEIAIQLGLSPFTVDEYVKSAVAKLGAPNRREAARLLAQEDVTLPSPHKLGDEPPAVAPHPQFRAADRPVSSEGSPARRLPFLRQGRRYNDLGWRERLFWILVGGLGIIVLFSQLANGMQIIESMFRGR